MPVEFEEFRKRLELCACYAITERWRASMTDRDPIWDALKEHSKEKFDRDRAAFLAKAKKDDDGGWTKHTEYHWSRTVNGKRLDYWPSRKKYQYEGKVRRGDVMKIVRGA